MTGRPSCSRFSFPFCCFLLCFLRCFLGGGGLRFCSCLVLFPVCLPRSVRSAVFGPPLLPSPSFSVPSASSPSSFCLLCSGDLLGSYLHREGGGPDSCPKPTRVHPKGRKPRILEPGRPAGHANFFKKSYIFLEGAPSPGLPGGPRATRPTSSVHAVGGRGGFCFG